MKYAWVEIMAMYGEQNLMEINGIKQAAGRSWITRLHALIFINGAALRKIPMPRPAFDKRTLILRSSDIRDRALALVANLPIDADKPLQLVVSEYKASRKLDQQALMWVGPLKDIAEQAWLDGKQFSADCWHHYFKVQLLPEEFDPELCLEDYRKWEYDPAGDRVLVGSTTKLTKKGMAQHIEAIHAFGASLGVHFHANPNEVTR